MSHAELVVLTLLCDGPSHAYDLVQRVSEMQIARWTRVAESTLYMVLKRLKTGRFLRGRVSTGDRGGDRTIYTITAKGRRRKDALLRQGLTDPAPLYSDRIVASVFAAVLGDSDSIDAAVAAAKRTESKLEWERRDAECDELPRVILDFYHDVARAQVKAMRALSRQARRVPAATRAVR